MLCSSHYYSLSWGTMRNKTKVELELMKVEFLIILRGIAKPTVSV